MDYRFTAEQEALKQHVRTLAEEKLAPMAEEIEERDDIQPGMVRILAEGELFRLLFPKEYGGAGEVSAVKICIAREQLSRISLVADTTLAMSGLGCYAIAHYGTEAQKRKYIPPLAAGEKLGSFGLTEPMAGSDVANIQSTAVLEGDHYILNGRKRFISNGNAADTLVVFAKTAPEKRAQGISAFILEKGTPGFESRYMKLMFAHDLAELQFKDCRLPAENRLGEPGQGWTIALGNLDLFRPTIAASSVGCGQAALDMALDYARKRHAFGRPIAGFQAIQFKLADMATELVAARCLVYRAASLHDSGEEGLIKEASMAKLFASEAAKRIVDQAMRIHGGLGIVKGNRIERLYRQITMGIFGEGTSEIQKLTIARQLLKN
ncbi:MAG: acyl-CoA dehydrogenase family protein [Deltaproteobacteria bacterium]|nr:acyl-CoA dehydrogenase family protein [Deltaproteobacteria bacterium]